MNTRYYKKRVSNNNIMLTLMTVCILVVLIFIHSSIVNADESYTYEKSFKTIEIQSGTTLSSLAYEYAKPGQDLNEYIEEVQRMNNMTNSTIKTGCYLIIPIYVEVES